MTIRDLVTVLRNTELPNEEDVGSHAVWELPSGDEVLRVHGRFLGVSTSFTPHHHHHEGREFARQDEKCRACRWFEPRIFRESDGRRRYLIHRTGRSTVPGEVTFTSHEWALTGHEVIEALTTRRRSGRGDTDAAYLTYPAARVLAQAAGQDEDLDQAYVDRAVA